MSHLLHAVLLASSPPHPPLSLIVGTYGGEILTLGFCDSYGTLQLRYSTEKSAPAPSWQCLSRDRRWVYTVEEQSAESGGAAGAGDGAVATYAVDRDGRLKKCGVAKGLYGPVSLDISPDGKLLFAACYDGRGVSAYQVDPESGAISHLQDWTYRLPKPGVVKDRQDAAHPHQALFDPSGKFILVPDLGADMIRTFRVDGSNVQEHSQIRTIPGTGPRHGAFVHAAGSLRYLLVGELSNTVTVFTVSYSAGGDSIDLVEDQTISTLPKSHPRLSSTAAEIVVKDSFVYVSNRGDSVFYGSDSIALYRICCNGMLELCGFYESGVRIPRHISIDPSGEWLVATGQDSCDVKIFRRNRTTGGIGDRPVATYNTNGGAVCATWL